MATRLPAEWEQQSATLLSWPHANTDWKDILPEVEPDFVRLARAILKHQPLIIVVPNGETEIRVAALLEGSDRTPLFFRYECDDTWIRDYGPITSLVDERAVLNDFIFNGWGRKFDASLDNGCPFEMHKALLSNSLSKVHDIVLEGGAIDSNGAGIMLTTSSCLLTETRNPDMSREDWEALFAEEFGIHTTLWLDSGYLAGDDTDSHIDTLARFIAEDHIVYVKCNDPEDEHYEALQKMEAQLQALCENLSETHLINMRLTPLPWPSACFERTDDHRLPATYANFLLLNNAVIVPIYDDPKADHTALEIFRLQFPDYDIIPVPSNNFIRQHGSIHCLTMQLPVQVELTQETGS